MQKIKVAINGFGRIGRIALRQLLQQPTIEVVAINDIADADTIAHLFKYDSVHGAFLGSLHLEKETLLINNTHAIQLYHEKTPELLPWKQLGIDVVIEATGKFTQQQQAALHLRAGAKKVIISAPSPDRTVPTICLGINNHIITPDITIISNASCTTNNVASLVKVLDETWGIEDGYITTIHSYTTDQNLHDAPHRDLRRARAAAQSIIPTSTGAAKAITSIFPHLQGKLGGAGIRVPVPNGSLTDFTCILQKHTTVTDINLAFKQAAQTSLKGILAYTEDPIVSVDILGNTHSCVFDAQLTSIVGKLVKVVGWYDNEVGYASRLAELVPLLYQ